MAHQTVVVLLLILGAAATASEEKHSKCAHGWSHFGGRCLRYEATPKDWVNAEKHCKGHGGHLVSIHSNEEYKHVRDFARRHDPHEPSTWIGLNDRHKAFEWHWSDGTHVRFTAWAPGEPNNLGNKERCVHMNWGVGKQWNDAPCDIKYPFVCGKH